LPGGDDANHFDHGSILKLVPDSVRNDQQRQAFNFATGLPALFSILNTIFP